MTRSLPLLCAVLMACEGPDEDMSELTGELETIARARDGLNRPTDLAFNAARPDELWIVNEKDDSVTVVFDAPTGGSSTETFLDPARNHFLEKVSSIAFSNGELFGTCQNSTNTYDGQAVGNNFMGPALWTSDLDIFAQSNPEAVEFLTEEFGFPADLGSHLDMLHESPLCMGIAFDRGNVYWVFDGFNGSIVRYDFQEDHGVGYDDHSDGIISRVGEDEVQRVAGVVSHLALDRDSKILYIADTGNGRIATLDTRAGERGRSLRTFEPGTDHHMLEGVEILTFVEGLDRPSGIEVVDGQIIVAEHGTGLLHVYDDAGIETAVIDTTLGPDTLAGIWADSLSEIWIADFDGNAVHRLTTGLLILLLAFGLAHGHAGAAIEAVDVLLDHGPPLVEASVGLISLTDDAATSICHEAITTPDAILLPRYDRGPDGTLIGWLTDPEQARDRGASLYRSETGCAWDAPTGLSGLEVVAARFDPSDADVVVVLTRNRVYRSGDGGQSFGAAGPPLEGDEVYTSLVAGPTGIFWAGSTTSVHHSDDQGSTWTVSPVTLPDGLDDPDPKIRVMGAHPSNPDEAWLLADTTAIDVLLETTDGGATTAERYRVEGYLSDVAVEDDGGVWVGENGLGFLHAEDGVDFRIVRAPPGLGVSVDGEQVWVTARFELTNQGVLVKTGDGGFEQVFSYFDPMKVIDRPAGTAAAEACPEAFEALQAQLGFSEDTGGDTDVGTDDEGAACGCASGAGMLGWWVLLGVAGGVRRRTTR